jgi:hypothetical protein
MALLTAAFVLFGILALGGGVLDVKPGLVEQLSKQSFAILAVIGLAAALVGFLGGLVIGKVRS